MKTYIVTDMKTGRELMRGTLQQWDEWFNKHHASLLELPNVISDSRTEKRITVNPVSSMALAARSKRAFD